MSLPRPLLALTVAAAGLTVFTLGTTGLAAGSPSARPAPAVTLATAAGATVAAAPAAAAQLPTDDRLRAALLTADELGPDFTELPVGASPSPESDASPVAGCDALRALLNRETARGPSGRPHQGVEFDGPAGNPMITESLTAEEPDRLTTDFAAVTAAFADCRSITFTDDTGAPVVFTVTPVALGDRPGAPAVRLDGELAGIPLNGYLGLERLGDVALSYGFFQRDSVSPQLASLYYRAAVAKAERNLGAPAGSTTAPTAPGVPTTPTATPTAAPGVPSAAV
ncbi:hypothetical protein PUR61_11235 [Streptomyces sp. BE20]|uniref:hypothetical protein n=1 Tax=Streptomyces sp. BE20 TaxID=3002525 RepID=UPI002E79E0E9|nr:hypothetical protein [Streptomyces sp. BE20]MEE1822763.1 hypothetical protein [Streptomyces sp. BE20]